jgi:hypothetical protein
MTPVAPDEILTSLNTEGERAREGEGEKKKKTIGLRMTDERHTPLTPLNGGMNSTIPLLGGVSLAAGRVPFSFSKLSTSSKIRILF